MREFYSLNPKNIFFNNNNDRDRFVKACKLSLSQPEILTTCENTKKIINQGFNDYANIPNGILFQKNPQRNHIINKTVGLLQPYFTKTSITPEDHLAILKILLEAKKSVELSHLKEGSIFAFFGFTQSRLARLMNKSIDKLIANKYISNADYIRIKREVETKVKNIPAPIPTNINLIV